MILTTILRNEFFLSLKCKNLSPCIYFTRNITHNNENLFNYFFFFAQVILKLTVNMICTKVSNSREYILLSFQNSISNVRILIFNVVNCLD